MDVLSFFYKNALVPSHDLETVGKKLRYTINELSQIDQRRGYDNPYAVINVPSDKQIVDDVMAIWDQKKKYNPSLMIVVGIGGSNLGTQAIYEALYGKDGNPDFPLYFADTVDSDYIATLLRRAEDALKSSKKILITVISKSGNTTETIANFECFLALLQKYHPHDYSQYVVTITDKNSALWHRAQQQKFACLAIPEHIGGRYSVLSAVGLFPLIYCGIDIDALREGAQSIIKQCITEDATNNYAAISAAIIVYHYNEGICINNLFMFSVALESLGKWYRQLMGESIGKEKDIHGKKVNVGIAPTVAIGTTDLHSVGQLYFGGPNNTLTTFVSVKKNNYNIMIPEMPLYEQLVANIQNKPLASVMSAIFEGVQIAYEKNKRPFMTVIIPEKNAYYIGQFLQWKMIEMIYIGALLEVNPFDQPEVELYKTQTRKMLAHE